MSNSAGILPFTRHNGEILFLLGKDVRDSCYSDFGGKMENIDQHDPINTANREFYEETLGILSNSPFDLRQRIKDLSVCVFGSTKNQHVYRMYLLEIPFDKNLPKQFKKNVSFLTYKNIGMNYIEKTDLVWCNFDELFRIPKRTVFAATIRSNIQILRRLSTESWRKLCEEYKNYDTLSKCKSEEISECGGKYVLPFRRKISASI